MQSDNRFLDDLAKLATGAAGAVTSARAEAESAFRAWLDRRLGEMDLVTREEFEATREMAAQAREESARLAERVEALEAELAKTRQGARTAAGKSAGARAGGGGTKSRNTKSGTAKDGGAQEGASTRKGNGRRSSS